MLCYVYQNGKESGPVEMEALRGSVGKGSVRLDDFARTEGMNGWVTVEQLLHGATAAVPASGANGAAAAAAPAAAPSPVPQSRPEPQGNAVTWPFCERGWAGSVWMPMLWWVSPPVFSLGLFLALGWMFEAVRRRARHEPARLPAARHMARMLKDGFVIMLMVLPYFVIPLAIIAKLSAWEGLDQVQETAAWVWAALWGHAHAPFWEFITREAALLLADSVAPGVYLAIAIPMFLAACARYALTDRLRVFFSPFHNAAVVLRHFGGFLKYMLFSFLAVVVLKTAALMFVATGIGVLVSIALVASEFWILAYWGGDLAAEIASNADNIRVDD